jgi:hypothetical protein
MVPSLLRLMIERLLAASARGHALVSRGSASARRHWREHKYLALKVLVEGCPSR